MKKLELLCGPLDNQYNNHKYCKLNSKSELVK